ncbi:thermonuclease family protein [Actinospongicola halichondriae]|uniref:thermonuclease family protein n=1 Tax=Actinospongicola halichondriae TaxID=3236844 RepID=UPI003D3E157B
MAPGDPRPAGRPDVIRIMVVAAAVAVAALFAAWSGALDSSGGPTAAAGEGVVVRVIDGDTVDVDVDGAVERVRLIGVDTPEAVAPERPIQCYGVEASAHTKELLPEGTAVRLERDEVSRDQYGRLLAYLYRVDDDLLVNLDLIEQGFADAVTYGDNEALYDTFVAAESAARSGGVGLWSACGGPDVDIAPAPG